MPAFAEAMPLEGYLPREECRHGKDAVVDPPTVDIHVELDMHIGDVAAEVGGLGRGDV